MIRLGHSSFPYAKCGVSKSFFLPFLFISETLEIQQIVLIVFVMIKLLLVELEQKWKKKKKLSKIPKQNTH